MAEQRFGGRAAILVAATVVSVAAVAFAVVQTMQQPGLHLRSLSRVNR
jgi:hypothetical protein